MRLSVLFLSSAAIFWVIANAQPAVAQNARVRAEAERITGDHFDVSARTPQGASISAINKPSALVLKAIDQG